jgi:zinc and cadmium transporter
MPDAGTTLLAIGSVVGVSLVSLAGLATLSLDAARLRSAATVWVAFAAGALLGDAFIHLIPEIFAERGDAGHKLESSLLVLCGMVLFFVVEKLLRHQHGPIHDHFHGHEHGQHQDHRKPALAAINLIGDGIHNFIDGMLIGTSYLASPTLGVSTTVAVLLHEVPQEIGDFGVLVHSGVPVRKAVLLNLVSASAALLGTVLALFVGSTLQEATLGVALPIAAGGFVYIAAADLIPELQHDKSPRSIFLHSTLLVTGIATMGLLTLVE